MIEFLIQIDKEAFLILNSLHSPFGDWFMHLVSHKLTWIPLYIYFIYYIFKKTKKKLIVLGAVLLMVGLTDICASQIAKPTFQRLRPCHDTSLSVVHTVNNHCGKQYGFFSSHASNMFGLATFFAFLISHHSKKKLPWVLLVWAVVIGYSRIYLGVHFPLDILAGFFCGFVIARIMYFLLQKIKAI